MNYTVSENELLYTAIQELENQGEAHLVSILKLCKIVYDPRSDFSKVIPDQRKLYASIRVPNEFKKTIIDNNEKLSHLLRQIYINDDVYYFIGLSSVGLLPIQVENIEVNNKQLILNKNSIYITFLKSIDNILMSDLQKRYLIEACLSGDSNNLLSTFL